MEFERKRIHPAHINIAPLVDMVFLLLLFFMLTTHWVQEPAIRIRLPESTTAEIKREDTKTIFIDQAGDIYWMDQKIELHHLKKVIAEQMRDREKETLKIKSDKEVKVELLIRVIDEVRRSGVKQFSILTTKKEDRD